MDRKKKSHASVKEGSHVSVKERSHVSELVCMMCVCRRERECARA